MLVNAVNEVNRYNVHYDYIDSAFNSSLHVGWLMDVHKLPDLVSYPGNGQRICFWYHFRIGG